MKRQELIDYLQDLGFEETSDNIYSKEYDNGKFVLEYKLTKQMVHVYYKSFNKKIKRMKGRYKNINKTKDNSLSGFTILKEGK